MATLTISDRSYQKLQALAQEQGQTPEAFIESWVEQQGLERHDPEHDPYTNPRYYTTEEWFGHLGMTEEQIRRAAQLASNRQPRYFG